jgi:hypothetical protein
MSTHTLLFQFSCRHEYFDYRVPGGVSDWEDCLCDSCQPYHAVLVVNHPCRHCGGSSRYFRDAIQIKLSDAETECRIQRAFPLFPKSYGHTVKTPSVASMS